MALTHTTEQADSASFDQMTPCSVYKYQPHSIPSTTQSNSLLLYITTIPFVHTGTQKLSALIQTPSFQSPPPSKSYYSRPSAIQSPAAFQSPSAFQKLLFTPLRRTKSRRLLKPLRLLKSLRFKKLLFISHHLRLSSTTLINCPLIP